MTKFTDTQQSSVEDAAKVPAESVGGTKGYYTPAMIRNFIAAAVQKFSSNPYTWNFRIADASAAPDTAVFGFCGDSGSWSNAGGALTNPYWDHTAFLGFNLKDGGVRIDNTKPAFGLGWESKFTQTSGTRFGHEFYMRCLRSDGTEFRPFGCWIDYEGAATGTPLTDFMFNTAVVYLNSPTAGTVAGQQEIKCDWAADSIYVFNGNAFVHAVNNVPVAKQRNGAGTADIALPYIDWNDKLELGSARVLHSAAVSTIANDPIHSVAVQGTPTVNQTGYAISFAAATGKTITGVKISGTTDWNVTSQFINYGTGTAHLDILTNSNAPAFTKWVRIGGQEWSAGKNTSDNFEISTGSTPGAGTVLTADKTSKQVAFVAAPKLPSFTVATLPSASTFGAGSMIYVSDETGGAVPAFSDGTNWRRVTDRAIAA